MPLKINHEAYERGLARLESGVWAYDPLSGLMSRALDQPWGAGMLLGSKSAKGYITVQVAFKPSQMSCFVHRLAYLWMNGPIPDGFVVDHINDVKSDNRFVNFQLLTFSDNVTKVRGKAGSRLACMRGHPYTEENTQLRTDGSGLGQRCKECKTNYNKDYWQKQKLQKELTQ